MEFSEVKVLIFEGYARQTLPMAKAFNKLGCEVTTLNHSKLDVGYTSKYPTKKIVKYSSSNDYVRTVNTVRELLKSGEYNLVVPMSDFSASLLSRNKDEFSNYAKIASNDWEIYDIAQDKLKTMEICMERGIPCPLTLISVESIEEVINSDLNFPIVVKPRIGYGAIGFKVANNEAELREYIVKNKINISFYVFQEYIPQSDVQFEAAMFVDNENEIKTSLVFSKNRWFPIEGGSSTFNITVDRKDIVESCSKLLKDIGWRGCADVDLIQDPRDGIAKIMEINPRVSGSVKICFEAGVDLAKQIIQREFDHPVTSYNKYKIGQRLRCSQTDLLWFIKSSDRLTSKPSWFSMKKTKDQTFSLADPLPWFSYSIQSLGRYRKEMKKRSD
ncbi:ATP-grasp domain-containing protein [Halobacillus campisalis]|uniref:ATP-grasp domain-containing protein n=1 Tax=Halobacillus campisalis TaxID=435909 RepID=A0ABW2JXT3_9BACI|nr:ATP-grasp domain-containing protein [Halobacillus campisalis]